MLTEIDAGRLMPVNFVRLAYPSATFRLHDFAGVTLDLDGEDYVGDGTLLGFDSLSERADGKVGGLTIGLSAANETLKAAFRDDKWHFKHAQLSLGLLQPDYSFIDTPISFGTSYMSTGEWSTEGASISQVCEPVTNDLRRVAVFMSSDADQQSRYPDDTIFTHTSAMDEIEVNWGGRSFIFRDNAGRGGGGSGASPFSGLALDPLYSPFGGFPHDGLPW